jgi:DNA (cytosine-5)-methyltransferase 1
VAAYYNEFEPYAAEWLRNLIKAGYIPDGEVDTRSIVDVQPLELRGFTQCHFFAGIGGWGYALRLAGWPDDCPIWTGSCPCQPFSSAGKRAGTDDPRHLWPHFHRLIAANRPPVVMGEQVAGAAGYGWFDGVRADLAREDYASRGVNIPACAIGAAHIRQRLYWVSSDSLRVGSARHKQAARSGEMRQGWAGSKEDLLNIANDPFVLRERHAQPLLRRGDDGLSTRVGRMRAYGNAIVPQVVAEVIAAYMESV